MPEPRKASAGKQDEASRIPASAESPLPGGASGAYQPMTGVEQNFAKAVERLGQEAQQASARTYNEYLANVAAIWTDLQQRNIEAHRTLLEELKAAFGGSDTLNRCVASYQEYVTLARALWDPTDLRNQTADAYNRFIAAVSEGQASATPQRSYDEASRAYIDGLKAAWDRSDLYTKVDRAFRSYLGLLREAQGEGEARATEAYRKFVDRVRDNAAAADVAGKLRSAADAYGKRLQEVMSGAQASHREATLEAVRAIEQALETAPVNR